MPVGRQHLRRLGFVTVAIAVAIPISGVMPSALASRPPTPAQIQSMKERANTLSARLTRDQNIVAVASEQYDEYVIILGQDKVKLHRTERALARLRNQVAQAILNLRSAAVEAYMTDNGAAAQLAVLQGSVNDSGSIAAYAGTVSDTLRSAEHQLQNTKSRVAADVAAQAAETRTAAADVQKATDARDAAVTATAQIEAILHQVKGQLAAMIVERQRALAAAAAARARRIELARERAQALAAARLRQAQEAAAAAAKAVTPADPGGHAGGLPPVSPGGSGAGARAVAAAESFIGVPYVWGGASRSGVDCSGLTMLAWAAAGVQLEHGATAQYDESQLVPQSQIRPGDLLFYHFANDGGFPITHVAMYVGSGPYGSQTIIQAAQTGTNVGFYPMYWVGFVAVGRP